LNYINIDIYNEEAKLFHKKDGNADKFWKYCTL